MNNSRRRFLKQSTGLAAAPFVLTIPGTTTAPADPRNPARLFRFAVASDAHYGQPGTDYKGYMDRMIGYLKAEKERSGLDVCVFNGDLIHDEPRFLPEVKAAFSQLPIPYYVTRGNHDKVSPAVWEQTWGYPENHVVELGDYAFVLGNTSNEKGEYVCADAGWLASALNSQRRKKHVFVFLHIPQQKWTKNGIDCPAVMEVIGKQANVKAIFHGHEHDQDGVKLVNNKPFLFDGHIGGNWGTSYRGYRIVEVFADGRITTYQFDPEVNPFVNGQTL